MQVCRADYPQLLIPHQWRYLRHDPDLLVARTSCSLCGKLCSFPDNFDVPVSTFFASNSPCSGLVFVHCYFEPVVPSATKDFLFSTLLSLPSFASNLLFVLCLTLSWSFQNLLLIVILLFQTCRNWRAQPRQPCPAVSSPGVLCYFVGF